jgi:hypothetical protein
LVALTLDHPATELRGIYAVCLPDRHPAAKVRAFIDLSLTGLWGHRSTFPEPARPLRPDSYHRRGMTALMTPRGKPTPEGSCLD